MPGRGNASSLYRFTDPEPRYEIGEARLVTLPALGMILDGQGKWVIAQPRLFYDVIGLAPGLDFETLAETIEGLVVGAVDAVEPMRCRAIDPEWLDVAAFHFRLVVTGNVEAQGATERHVKELHAFTDREDWQPALGRIFRPL